MKSASTESEKKENQTMIEKNHGDIREDDSKLTEIEKYLKASQQFYP